jgi:hypothetical protein
MAASEVEAQLAELERRRRDGEISEITFTVQRNLLITRAEQSARRRAAALRVAPPLPRLPPPPDPGLSRQLPVSRRTALRILGAAIVVGLVLIAYHLGSSSTPSSTDQGQPTASTPPASTPASSAPATAPASSAARPAGAAITSMDESQPLPGGATATLIGYTDHFAPTSTINNPLPSGSFYAAVELRVCAGGQGTTTVSPFAYVLVEPGNQQASIASGPAEGVQPQLQLTQVAPGHCVSGWLSYGVPARPTQLQDTVDRVSWTIPAA